MKILGIGNAIVDVICKVDDNFLSNNKLTKSTMKLVDEKEFKKLLSNLKIEELTLYTINQEKKIEAQEQLNQSLLNRLSAIEKHLQNK